MKSPLHGRWNFTGIAVAISLTAFCLTTWIVDDVHAEEPRARFLEALKNAQYFDTAADYIEQLQKQSQLSAEEKLSLNYELGELLWKKSLATRDPKVRDEVMGAAQTKIQEFLKAAPEHPNAPDALVSLARISHIRGLNIRKLAAKLPLDQREPELKRAREQLNTAKSLLEQADKKFVGYLTPIRDKLTKKQELTKTEEDMKDRFFPALLEVRLLQGECQYELALTYDVKAKEYTAALEASSKEFKEAYEKYTQGSTKLGAGYSARIKQARNMILLKKPAEGSEYAWEVFNVDGVPSSIFKQALRVALEATVLNNKIDKDAWKQIEDALKDVPRITNNQDAEIYYYAALCGEKAKLTPADKAKAQTMIVRLVRDLLRYRAQFDYYAETRELAKRLNIKAAGERRTQSFADLLLEAKQAYSQYAEAFSKWSDFQGPAEERTELEEVRNGMHDAAYDAAMTALMAASRDTKPDDLSFLRFVLCSYHSSNKNLYEAITWGEATANGAADTFAQRAAGITIKSLQALKQELQKFIADELSKTNSEITIDSREVKSHPEVSALNERLRRAAGYLIKTWSSSAEADSARLIFIGTEIDKQDFAAAAKMIEQMRAPKPNEADLRGTAELMLGSSAAQRYLSQKYGKTADDTSRAAAEKIRPYAVNGLKATLLKQLSGRMDSRGVMAAYLWLLIQLREENVDADAIKLLDDPKQGLAVLIQKDSPEIPAAQSFDIGRVVFQVYLMSGNSASAVKMIQQLEAAAKNDPERKRLITGIIMQAGRELDRDIRDYREKNQLAKAKNLVTAYKTLLEKLLEQADTLDFGGLYGISESYLGLAESDDANAAEHIKQAELIYSKILKRAEQNPAFATANVLQVIKVKQIGLMRSRGDYAGAYNKLKEILKPKPANIIAQKEAALTLQEWAASMAGKGEEQFKKYNQACAGEYDDKNVQIVWGWTKLWQTMYRQPNFSDAEGNENVRSLFFEARYNVAWCRLKMAEGLKDSDSRKEKLFASVIESIRQSYVDVDQAMGGPTRKADFEKVLKAAQTGKKLNPNGYKAFETTEGKAPADK